MRVAGPAAGLLIGWFAGGLAYMATDGLAERAGLDLGATATGAALSAVGAVIGEILTYRRSTDGLSAAQTDAGISD